MIPTEKLAAACFAENVQLFGDARQQTEKHNHYKGLMAMAQVLEEVLQGQRRLEMQLRSVNNALNQLVNLLQSR